jgi:hypothetical protein
MDEERSRARTSFGKLHFILLIRFPVTIAAMEFQIESMRNSISPLKNQKEKKSKKRDAFSSTPATTSKAAKKETKTAAKKKSAPKKAPIPNDDDALSFEQELSEAI